MLVAGTDGRGFVVDQDDMVGGTRKGRQVLDLDKPAKARLVVPAVGDQVAVIGENRRLLVFPLAQLPEMARGKGVRLQRFKDGGLSDCKTFSSPTACPGRTARDAASTWWEPTCANGSARGRKPAACRRRASPSPTSSPADPHRRASSRGSLKARTRDPCDDGSSGHRIALPCGRGTCRRCGALGFRVLAAGEPRNDSSSVLNPCAMLSAPGRRILLRGSSRRRGR